MTQPWVMRVETPRGAYFFNHVTGRHGFLDEAAAKPAPQQQAPPVDSPTYHQPASSPPPYPQQPPTGAAASPPATPAKPAPAADRAYEGALMSKEKGGWRRFMEPLATAAAEELTRVSGNWDYACPVCEQAQTRGLADHVPSEKHWKRLGEKLSWRPPSPGRAHATDQPWVQRIDTCRGCFLFNHLTGAYGLEGQARVAPPSPATPSTACSTPSPAPAADSSFNHAHWLWVRTVDKAAGQVDELTSHPRFEGGPPQCIVCDSGTLSRAHLVSAGHFDALQRKCKGIPEDIAKEAMVGHCPRLEGDNPLVQKLELDGIPYPFNHVTGRELWS